jgi:hypothetical protein
MSRPPIRSPTSAASADSRTIALATAVTSLAGAPRKPSSSRRAFSLSSRARARVMSSGGTPKTLSAISSTSTPPAPAMTRDPNCGSRTMPSASSAPGETMADTVTSGPSDRDIAA